LGEAKEGEMDTYDTSERNALAGVVGVRELSTRDVEGVRLRGNRGIEDEREKSGEVIKR